MASTRREAVREGLFDIYETAGGLRQVANPVKRAVLRAMEEGEVEVARLIRLTGLSKSTLSLHLANLGQEKLLAYREDPHDRRRKRYYLTALRIGSSTTAEGKLRESVLAAVPSAVGDPQAFAWALLRTVKFGLDSAGLRVGPLVRELGRDAGEAAAKGLEPAAPDELVARLADFWASHGLGSLERASHSPLKVRVRGCALCRGVEPTGAVACSLVEGLLEGFANSVLRASTRVDELECRGTGHHACVFRVELSTA